MTFFFPILSGILTIFLCASIYYNIKFGKVILEVQESVENSLDTLDERFLSISKILEKPVFFDSVEVRQAMQDIKLSRDSILYVANVLVAPFGTQEETQLGNKIEEKNN